MYVYIFTTAIVHVLAGVFTSFGIVVLLVSRFHSTFLKVNFRR
jgi:hypothetical protein